MDWSNIGAQVILGIIGVLLTGLGTLITVLINKYVKDKKANELAASFAACVMTQVQSVYQTYVQGLKDKNMFDADAQKEALNMCIQDVKENCTKEVLDWLKNNYADIDKVIRSQIEASIKKSKDEGKK